MNHSQAICNTCIFYRTLPVVDHFSTVYVGDCYQSIVTSYTPTYTCDNVIEFHSIHVGLLICMYRTHTHIQYVNFSGARAHIICTASYMYMYIHVYMYLNILVAVQCSSESSSCTRLPVSLPTLSFHRHMTQSANTRTGREMAISN